jgi:hypothetical protein
VNKSKRLGQGITYVPVDKTLVECLGFFFGDEALLHWRVSPLNPKLTIGKFQRKGWKGGTYVPVDEALGVSLRITLLWGIKPLSFSVSTIWS